MTHHCSRQRAQRQHARDESTFLLLQQYLYISKRTQVPGTWYATEFLGEGSAVCLPSDLRLLFL